MTEPLDPERLALICRTLQISADVWHATLQDYDELRALAADNNDPALRLRALGEAYRRHAVHDAPLPTTQLHPCPACGATSMRPLLARRPGPLVFGRCAACAHGALLEVGATIEDPYREPRYYQERNESGVGYDAYGREAAYREAKGERLVARVAEITGHACAHLLEVGSGYGFTRAGAQRRGLRTSGVDVNPHACTEAARRYGLATFAGTLAQALATAGSGVTAGAFDWVLYQFVLEHIVDLHAELRQAAAALSPNGWLVLMVPSMEAAEIDVFGASYRSFRADHRHLFSRASMDLVLGALGFTPHFTETACNLHLLRGVLSEPELVALYAAGRGPDLFVVARKRA